MNLSLIKDEKTKLTQEFHKLVPMAKIEQEEVIVTLLHLLKSKVNVLEFNYGINVLTVHFFFFFYLLFQFI